MTRIKKQPVYQSEPPIEEPKMRNVESSDGTFRKVQVLANLANACQDTNIVNSIRALPDGDIILTIFTEALQLRIQRIMSNTNDVEIANQADMVFNQLHTSAELSSEIHSLLMNFHQSPLIEVLKSLTSNLIQAANTPKPPQPPQNPYAYSPQPQPNPNIPNGTNPPNQVTQFYQSQIEQTPLFSQRSPGNYNPAPTEPVRGGGINSF